MAPRWSTFGDDPANLINFLSECASDNLHQDDQFKRSHTFDVFLSISLDAGGCSFVLEPRGRHLRLFLHKYVLEVRLD